MKWLCKIGHDFHNFETVAQIVDYDESKSFEPSGQLVANKRFCKRCNLMQFQSIVSGNWYGLRPTIEDIREINLIKLGIK